MPAGNGCFLSERDRIGQLGSGLVGAGKAVKVPVLPPVACTDLLIAIDSCGNLGVCWVLRRNTVTRGVAAAALEGRDNFCSLLQGCASVPGFKATRLEAQTFQTALNISFFRILDPMPHNSKLNTLCAPRAYAKDVFLFCVAKQPQKQAPDMPHLSKMKSPLRFCMRRKWLSSRS